LPVVVALLAVGLPAVTGQGVVSATTIFTRELDVSTTAVGAADVTAADLDGDGDIDLASANFNEGTIAWYRNDGPDGFTTFDIDTGAVGPFSVTAADLDNDGDGVITLDDFAM